MFFENAYRNSETEWKIPCSFRNRLEEKWSGAVKGFFKME